MRVTGITAPAGIEKSLAGTERKEEQRGQLPFADVLKDAVAKVNDYQLQAEEMAQKLATGEIEDIHQVMIAAEKASLSLQLAVQARNKIVDAYQEIMRMQI
ncbi:MAG: flagellar hook-basal body complex protein FliE [Eubacteriales bacterium]|nr:flagellar hook-basal body complex protein FliE [Eubacteriales bacterium]MDN5363874.1 flagellar hook-basal body complex protein FliE [Eubacteriales bacterium]